MRFNLIPNEIMKDKVDNKENPFHKLNIPEVSNPNTDKGQCPFKGYEPLFLYDIKHEDNSGTNICYDYLISKYGKAKYDEFDYFLVENTFGGGDEQINSIIKEFNIPFVDAVALIVAQGDYGGFSDDNGAFEEFERRGEDLGLYKDYK